MDLRAPNVQEYAKRTSRIFHFDCVTYCCLLLIWMYSAESVKRTFFLVPNTYKDLQIQRRALHFIVYKTFVQIFFCMCMYLSPFKRNPVPYHTRVRFNKKWSAKREKKQRSLNYVALAAFTHTTVTASGRTSFVLFSLPQNQTILTLLCVYAWSQFIFRFHSVVFFCVSVTRSSMAGFSCFTFVWLMPARRIVCIRHVCPTSS